MKNPLRTVASLLDPVQALLLVNTFAMSFIEAFADEFEKGRAVYALTSLPTDPVHYAQIECSCGNTWNYIHPCDHPQRCPACDGFGKLGKKVSN